MSETDGIRPIGCFGEPAILPAPGRADGSAQKIKDPTEYRGISLE